VFSNGAKTILYNNILVRTTLGGLISHDCFPVLPLLFSAK